MPHTGSSELIIHELRSLSELDAWQHQWERLASSAPDATPFQAWPWNYGIASSHGANLHLRVLVAKDRSGETVGIAPFCIRRPGGAPFGILEFISSGRSDYLDLLALEAHRQAFAQAAWEWISGNREWSVMSLRSLRQDSLEWIASRGSVRLRPNEVSFRAVLPARIETFENGLPSQLRSILKRKGRPLAADGRLEFTVSQTKDELKADLEVLFGLHQRRRTQMGDRGRFYDQRQRDAFHALSETIFGVGMLHLAMARIDGQPAACVYNLRWRDREYFYQGGVNTDLARHSPGSLLHEWMIRRAIAAGVRIYDFGRGGEAYKALWCNTSDPLWEATATRSRLAGAVWAGVEGCRSLLLRSTVTRRVYHATLGRWRRRGSAGSSNPA